MKSVGDLAFYLSRLLAGKAIVWDSYTEEGRLRAELWKSYQNNTLTCQLCSLLEDWYSPSTDSEIRLIMSIARDIIEDETIDTQRKMLEQLKVDIEQKIEPLL